MGQAGSLASLVPSFFETVIPNWSLVAHTRSETASVEAQWVLLSGGFCSRAVNWVVLPTLGACIAEHANRHLGAVHVWLPRVSTRSCRYVLWLHGFTNRQELLLPSPHWLLRAIITRWVRHSWPRDWIASYTLATQLACLWVSQAHSSSRCRVRCSCVSHLRRPVPVCILRPGPESRRSSSSDMF